MVVQPESERLTCPEISLKKHALIAALAWMPLVALAAAPVAVSSPSNVDAAPQASGEIGKASAGTSDVPVDVANDAAGVDKPPTEAAPATAPVKKEKAKGKWLFAPLLSNGPKLGLAGGGTANYLNQFDAGSPFSMTGLQAKYSNTGSWTAAFYNRSYWDNDSKRFIGAIVQAESRNDYNDYLGQGPASVDTHLQLYYARYQQRIGDSRWYVGGSYVYTNINPEAADDAADIIMTRYDIGNVYNGGLGLNLTYDTRDIVMNPKSGTHLEFAITSFNKAFAGDYDYWAYNAQASYFQPVSSKLTIAYNASWLATPNAPSASQATLRRYRGYTTGENTAENSIVAQVEARYAFHPRWEAAIFGGAASLFDGDHKISNKLNWYPMGGVGVRYILDTKSQSLIRMDFAMGKSGNSGLYLSLGQPF